MLGLAALIEALPPNCGLSEVVAEFGAEGASQATVEEGRDVLRLNGVDRGATGRLIEWAPMVPAPPGLSVFGAPGRVLRWIRIRFGKMSHTGEELGMGEQLPDQLPKQRVRQAYRAAGTHALGW